MRVNSMVFNYFKHYKHIIGTEFFLFVVLVELLYYDTVAVVKNVNTVNVTNTIIFKLNFMIFLKWESVCYPTSKYNFYSFKEIASKNLSHATTTDCAITQYLDLNKNIKNFLIKRKIMKNINSWRVRKQFCCIQLNCVF